MKTLAARKAVTAAQTELDRLMKENSQLDEARGVALSRRDAIIAKVTIRVFCARTAVALCHSSANFL